jgi:Flp pilus assembly protein TadG
MRRTAIRNPLQRPSSLSAFLRHEAGNISIAYALMLPVILGAAGIALDYSRAASERSKMQAVADAAAIAAARELQMARADPDKIAAVAKSYVTTQIADVAIGTKVDTQALKVRVDLAKDIKPTVAKIIWSGTIHLTASATAGMSGGLPLCLIGLDTRAPGTIKLEQNALLTAPSCVVYSNSKSTQGLKSMDDAVLKAGFICSAGGKVQTKNTNYSPSPQTDCPVISDPLAERKAPATSSCDYKNRVVAGTTTTLKPGVYCGGLIITHGAQVTLAAGVYTIKDGPLLVDKNASVAGDHVAISLLGAGTNLIFQPATTINLTAPKDGPLAGILIYDDPSGAPAPVHAKAYNKQGKAPREHLILSDNARKLLGTIYMPHGRLIIDATKPVADQSAYTVLVVRQLDLYSGPNLVLNTNYGASDIPVPRGVGPYGGKVLLTN